MNHPEDQLEGWPPERAGRARRPQVRLPFSPSSLVLVLAGLSVALIVVLLSVTGRLGVAQVEDNEIAVVVNYLNGKREVVTTPGYTLYLPFVQEIYLLDRSSQEFRMEGDEYIDDNHVPRLTVRAVDGSNFWFEQLTILYEIVPGDAVTLLGDSGPGDGFKKNWIKAYARSVLRDEFGRYSAVEAADPTQYTSAAVQSRDRLNELLSKHGVRVTRIITPKPKFDSEYEKAIEDRKEADQEVERLRAKEEQLAQEREQRLARVQKEKEIEMTGLVGDLTKELLAAEQQAIDTKRSADAYAIEHTREGEGELAQRLAQARGLEAKYTKEAEGLAKRAQALEERGEVVVREALVEKLAGIRFTLLPYSRDPEPRRLEHVQATEQNLPLIVEGSATQGDR